MVKMKLLCHAIAYLRYRDLSQKSEKQQIFDRYFPTHHKALLYIFNIIKQNLLSKPRENAKFYKISCF